VRSFQGKRRVIRKERSPEGVRRVRSTRKQWKKGCSVQSIRIKLRIQKTRMRAQKDTRFFWDKKGGINLPTPVGKKKRKVRENPPPDHLSDNHERTRPGEKKTVAGFYRKKQGNRGGEGKRSRNFTLSGLPKRTRGGMIRPPKNGID